MIYLRWGFFSVYLFRLKFSSVRLDCSVEVYQLFCGYFNNQELFLFLFLEMQSLDNDDGKSFEGFQCHSLTMNFLAR